MQCIPRLFQAIARQTAVGAAIPITPTDRTRTTAIRILLLISTSMVSVSPMAARAYESGWRLS